MPLLYFQDSSHLLTAGQEKKLRVFDLTAVDTDPVILEHPMVRPAALSRAAPSTHDHRNEFTSHSTVERVEMMGRRPNAVNALVSVLVEAE